MLLYKYIFFGCENESENLAHTAAAKSSYEDQNYTTIITITKGQKEKKKKQEDRKGNKANRQAVS